ncbi:MAG: hypothetical protein QW366_02690, partial [Sulfolobales archaeon]
MTRIILKTSRWLDDEEFREMLKISDYIGWSGGVAEFQFNPLKAVKNGFNEDEVIDLLRELNVEISEREVEILRESMRREIERSSVKVELNYA